MIGDVVGKVIVQYKADTGDLKKGIRELKGEEKKLAEEQLKQANARNAQLEKWKSSLLAVMGVFAAFGATAKIVWDAYKERAEKARLQTAAFGVQMNLLSKAALGTRTQMELLAEAARLNNGIFKLTSQEMAIVERAMIGLIRKGYDTEEVHKKVLEAVTQLKVDGLKDLGIVIDTTGASVETFDGRLKLVSSTMTALTGVAKGVTDTHRTMAEETEAATARMADSWRQFKEEWIIGSDAHMFLFDEKWRKAWAKNRIDTVFAASAAGKTPEEYQRDMDAALRAQAQLIQLSKAYAQRYPFDMEPMDVRAEMAKRKPGARGPIDIGYSLGSTVYGAGGVGGLGAPGIGGVDVGQGSFDRVATERWKAELEAYRAKNQSFMESTFGPVEEIDLYRDAFEGFTATLSSGFSAWIDGSKSVGQAMKDMLRDVLKQEAMQMFAESIKHAAYAVGSLAFGDIRGAATHGKAAAMFAAGAVTIGSLAKGLSGGGGSGGSGGSGGASAPGGGVPAYSGGQNQGGGSQTIVVAYGQDYSNESARQRQLRAAKVLEDARQATGGGDAVGYA